VNRRTEPTLWGDMVLNAVNAGRRAEGLPPFDSLPEPDSPERWHTCPVHGHAAWECCAVLGVPDGPP
jgi:hypothetical protein